ncbi:GerMN domain-containing protein [Paenibacillus sp. N4]|uniref:GerMN domain-containing protein n=1 Tax=Paenibacillus vietnamensis TaxID=2590547 RepID=UPI001CD113D5|nr:GerMN domain-containing protein [Paenibacillus vietnamensis]MCA0754353.1 GerMN domain-containing protein [Paenibacillus vietnamensis]
MTTSKTRGLLAFIVLSCALAGCGAQDKPLENTGAATDQPTASVMPSATASPEPSPSAEPTPAVKEYDATIYYTDAELLETIEKPAKLQYSNDEELIKAAVEALQMDAGEGAESLWKPIEILSVQLKDGLVTLDVQIPDEARLGAPGELLVIETLQKTLFQFEFVKSIDILVGGEAVESLMGHVDLEHPMNKTS